MVTEDYIADQLRAINVDFHLWGKAEIRELQHILVPNERIMHCVKGRYEGGFAVLVATDRRLLLIDKKPFFLTLEDVRYDMISEIDYSHRLLEASVKLRTSSKALYFTSARNNRLRALTAYTQDRIMRSHQQPTFSQQLNDGDGVKQLEYQAVNPYAKASLLMRKRVSRFYS